MTIVKDGRNLVTLGDWEKWASPQTAVQWKDGRSAKESARSWINAAPELVPEIAAELETCPAVGTLRSWCAEPEKVVKIDKYPKPPNIDVLIVGEDETGPLVVAIEAKSDEPFSNPIKTTLRNAKQRLMDSPKSKGVARLRNLSAQFELDLGRREVLGLRYQLLTLTAAAIAEARRQSARRAVVIVHEFVTALTDADKRDRNARDLDHFLEVVFGYRDSLGPGRSVGPFDVLHDIKLYYGKAQTIA